jgi:hypothetical protein
VSAAIPTSKMSAVRQIKAIGVVSNMSSLYRSFCVGNRGKVRRFAGIRAICADIWRDAGKIES